MWPTLVHMTKDEGLNRMRQLELDAYSMLVSALRAQGALTQEKRTFFYEACKFLNINLDRHKCEIRRAANDEILNTIAYHLNGQELYVEDWRHEGKRIMPLLQKISPQTLHPIIPDNLANSHQELYNFKEESNDIVSLEIDPNANKLEQNLDVEPTLMRSFKPRFYGHSNSDMEKVDKTYSAKKNKVTIVSNTESIPTKKTLSVPLSKVTKLNLEKFKIVPSSINKNTISSKKVIPLSQLHMLNHKLTSKGNFKVLPISSSKIFGKNITMTRITTQQGLKTSVLQNIISKSASEKIRVETIEDLIKPVAKERNIEKYATENHNQEKVDEEINEKSTEDHGKTKDSPSVLNGEPIIDLLMDINEPELIMPELNTKKEV